MSDFHVWQVGDAVFEGALGRVERLARTRWGTPTAWVVFPSGARYVTPPRTGHPLTVLDRVGVERLVTAFYAKASVDPMLGPVFASRITDWPHHIVHLTSFWASVLLQEGSFNGRPGPTHRALDGLTPAHFDRWLVLFEATLREVCEGPVIAAVMARAEAMRRGLSTHVFGASACS